MEPIAVLSTMNGIPTIIDVYALHILVDGVNTTLGLVALVLARTLTVVALASTTAQNLTDVFANIATVVSVLTGITVLTDVTHAVGVVTTMNIGVLLKEDVSASAIRFVMPEHTMTTAVTVVLLHTDRVADVMSQLVGLQVANDV